MCASSDAHVGFMCGDEFYEIVIGGWSNTLSVIRKKTFNTLYGTPEARTSTPGICNANKIRLFWAQALNGLVGFGKGNIIGENIVLQWIDPNPLIPDFVGFMTGEGSSGDWNVLPDLSLRFT